MAELPDKVRIGPISYVVKLVDDLHTTDADGKKQWLHGHILFADAIIKVAEDQAADLKIATIWHEALHGMMNQAGIEDHPERLIRMLGYGLVQLIRDNPALVKATIGEEQP